ncbi:hypothetical protein [uncultured Microscilla sp.]|uniref:hypothetical protein n=1 Tax=uncultured Microscilla sp. TaxID=432653 RepID=UPI0026196092|nr:hypothetical protein [uncultured Microscilla sp.]
MKTLISLWAVCLLSWWMAPNSQGQITSKDKTKKEFQGYQIRETRTAFSNGTMNFLADRDGTGDAHIRFWTNGGNNNDKTQIMTLTGSVNAWKLGINNTSPSHTLDVSGKVYAQGLTIGSNTFPDYVFAKGYKLMPLDQLRGYLKQYHHLPGMPTEVQVVQGGLKVGKMHVLLVEKVEELTLYSLQLHQQTQTLLEQITQLEKQHQVGKTKGGNGE